MVLLSCSGFTSSCFESQVCVFWLLFNYFLGLFCFGGFLFLLVFGGFKDQARWPERDTSLGPKPSLFFVLLVCFSFFFSKDKKLFPLKQPFLLVCSVSTLISP